MDKDYMYLLAVSGVITFGLVSLWLNYENLPGVALGILGGILIPVGRVALGTN